MLNKLIITHNGTTTTLLDADLLQQVSGQVNCNTDTDLQVGTACAASINFATKTQVCSAGDSVVLYIKQKSDNGWVQHGVFYVDTITKDTTNTKYTYTCYDVIGNTDIVVDTWKNGLNDASTYSIGALFASLCTTHSWSYNAYTGINYNVNLTKVKTRLAGNNVTGRYVLQQLAALCGGFVMADAQGKITIKHFATKSGVNFTSSIYSKKSTADYTVPAISCVRSAVSDDDVGVSYPTPYTAGLVELKIINNPLARIIDTGDQAKYQAVVQNIYNYVHNITYKPMSVTTFEDYGVGIGDIITVNSENFYVFSKSVSSSGFTFACTGNPTRSTTMSYNQKLNDISGKSAEFTVELDSVTSRLTDAEGNVNVIQQTMDGVMYQNGQGVTVINGSNITTGTISADRIDTTGLQAKYINVQDSNNKTVFMADGRSGTATAGTAKIGPLNVTAKGLNFAGTNASGFKVQMENMDTIANIKFGMYTYDPTGQGIFLEANPTSTDRADINDFNLNNCKLSDDTRIYTDVTRESSESVLDWLQNHDAEIADLADIVGNQVKKPVNIYDYTGGLHIAGELNPDLADDDGLAPANVSASTWAVGTWNITGSDFSLFKRLKIYWIRVDGSLDNCQGVTDLDLTRALYHTSSGTTTVQYMAMDSVPMWTNRNRLQAVQFTVNSAKTAFSFSQAYSLYGTAATTVDLPRVYKIEGWYN